MFEAFKESTAQLGLRLGMQPVVPLVSSVCGVVGGRGKLARLLLW